MADAPASTTARLAGVVFAVLCVATFGAFFLASRLKAQPAVLKDLRRLKYFSPNGDGRRDVERISFRVKLDDAAAIDIVDADGARVRRLADRARIREGRLTRVRWDGREDDGTIAPDGRYRIRLILRDGGRAVLAGKNFILDTRPPDPAVLVSARDPDDRIVAPGAPVQFRVRGTGTSTPPRFRVVRTDVRPQQTVRTWTGRRGAYRFTWDGLDDAGTPVAEGTYAIAVTSSDKAGNQATGPPLPIGAGPIPGRPGVTVRALAVQPPVRPVRAGSLVAFRVDARQRTYGWRVRRLGVSRPVLVNRRPKRGTTLLVRAPKGPSGVYLLEVSSHGASTRVPFAVQAAGTSPRGRPLVVLPAISWLGRDPLDDTGDGLPDTFAEGSPVPFPRVFAYPGGLPAGFAGEVAPLLVWMDRNHLRYDLTTDVALTLDGDAETAHRGLLFAGAPEWVSRRLARRLRTYVSGGGRVAIFGTGALRGSVTVGDARLTHATPPGLEDAFGARLAPVRTLPAGADGSSLALSVLLDDPALGLLEGFSGVLSGFPQVEELASPGPGSDVKVKVGRELSQAELDEAETRGRTPPPERGALTAVTRGKGLIIRAGLPAWAAHLDAGDAAVEQLTFNVVDLLHGARPRPRTAG